MSAKHSVCWCFSLCSICCVFWLVQTVELRVSMHCYGCAKKVQKHISKMDGMRQLILCSFFFWDGVQILLIGPSAKKDAFWSTRYHKVALFIYQTNKTTWTDISFWTLFVVPWTHDSSPPRTTEQVTHLFVLFLSVFLRCKYLRTLWLTQQ